MASERCGFLWFPQEKAQWKLEEGRTYPVRDGSSEELSETGLASEAGFPLRVPLRVTNVIYWKRGNQFSISLKMLLVKQIQES